MYDMGHFCILVLAQGKWKEQFKDKLIEKLNSNFLPLLEPRSKQEEIKMGWNEVPKEPLYEPGPEERCGTCEVLKELFENLMGVNEGLILFSHAEPDGFGLKEFFPKIFSDRRIKKVYLLELGFGMELTAVEVPDIKLQRISLAEFVGLVDGPKFKYGLIYEILREKY